MSTWMKLTVAYLAIIFPFWSFITARPFLMLFVFFLPFSALCVWAAIIVKDLK